jgi:hypothetical protein
MSDRLVTSVLWITIVAVGGWLAHNVHKEMLKQQNSPYVSGPAETQVQRTKRRDFEAVRMGETYHRVLDMLGEPSERLSETAVGGYRTIAATWRNENGSNAILMFQGYSEEPLWDLRVISKAQAGLR